MKRMTLVFLCALTIMIVCANAFASEGNIPAADQISTNPNCAFARWETKGVDTADNQSRAGEDGLEIIFAESGISASSGSVIVTASTRSNIHANNIGGVVQVQIYRNNSWQSYYTFTFETAGSSANVARSVGVTSGYYYRVVVSHRAITPYTTIFRTTTTRSVYVN